MTINILCVIIPLMQTMEELLRLKKIRLTPQRLAVYSVLQKGKRHLSAEDIYKKLRPQLTAISLATVYTTLESFIKMGLVQEIRITFGKSLFELASPPHHHFLCRRCGEILDVLQGPCPVYSKGTADGHRIESFQGYFYGVCGLCEKKGRSGKC